MSLHNARFIIPSLLYVCCSVLFPGQTTPTAQRPIYFFYFQFSFLSTVLIFLSLLLPFTPYSPSRGIRLFPLLRIFFPPLPAFLPSYLVLFLILLYLPFSYFFPSPCPRLPLNSPFFFPSCLSSGNILTHTYSVQSSATCPFSAG